MHLSQLVERFDPTKVIRVSNKDKHWFNGDCRLAFDIKHGVLLRWTRNRSGVHWDEFVHYQRRANAVYAEAMCQFSVRSRDVLMNSQCPHKWWSTLKSAVFGSSSDSFLPPLIGAGGGLVCESVGKAEMLSAHFDGKLSRDPVNLPSTCHPSPSLTTFAFRSREVKRLLLDLDFYGGTDPLGMFPLFLEKTAEVLAPLLAVVFLVRLGSFPVCWRVANVTPIPKGPSFSSAYNYRQISLTRILSKVFERLVLVRLGCFMEGRGVLPTTQFAYRKCLNTCDALLCVAHTLQSALEMGQAARIVQIDFSAAFDRVNHQGILFKLCSVRV